MENLDPELAEQKERESLAARIIDRKKQQGTALDGSLDLHA